VGELKGAVLGTGQAMWAGLKVKKKKGTVKIPFKKGRR